MNSPRHQTLFQALEEHGKKGTTDPQARMHITAAEARDLVELLKGFDQVPPRHCSQQSLNSHGRIMANWRDL